MPNSRKCPVCDGFMQRRNFRRSSGVIIDCCSRHGTWLDADELEQIAGFILSGGSTSPTLRKTPRPRVDPRSEAEFARLRVAREMRRSRDEPNRGSIVDVFANLLKRIT